MIVTRRHLSRRTILRGMGAFVALPVLDAMIPALTAQSRTVAAPVRRWITCYAPNGMAMKFWTPSAEGTAFDLPRTLEPLAPFRSRLSVLSGLADTAAISRPQEGGGDHARASGTFLTGVHIKKTPGAPEGAMSADQVAATTVGRETQFASLELGIDSGELSGLCDSGYNCSYISTVSWADALTPLLPENDPRALFDRLFGDATGTREERAERAREQRSILDAVTRKVAALNARIGPGDHHKLDEYLTAVRDIERRLQRVEHQSLSMPIPAAPSAMPADYGEHARIMMDLLVLALQADLTRVATFMLARETSGRAYPQIGVADAHHPLSHHQNDPEKIDRLGIINRFHVEQFAYLLEKLSATADGAGTLLDTSIALYGAGISDSDRHLHVDLPVVLVSGSSTGMAGGTHVRFPPRTPVANLHVSILDAIGVPTEKFGDSTGRLAGISA